MRMPDEKWGGRDTMHCTLQFLMYKNFGKTVIGNSLH